VQASPAITHALQRIFRLKLQWNVVAIPVFVALAIAAAIVNPHRITPPVADTLPRTLHSEAPVPSLPAGQLDETPALKPQSSELAPVVSNSKSAFRRVRIGQDEVDEVSDDVTIRHFRSRPTPLQTRSLSRQVNLGEDVTVRYFTPDGKLLPRGASVPGQAARDPFPSKQ
jgi:hypothetical protein